MSINIITTSLPDTQKIRGLNLYSVVPWCNHTAPVVTRNPVGYRNSPWVSDAIVYGNQQYMRAYTGETHNFCMEMLELFEGKYPCNFNSQSHKMHTINC
jgi:hypothetical protein